MSRVSVPRPLSQSPSSPSSHAALALWVAWTAACAVGGTAIALASPFLAETWLACFGLATSGFMGLLIALPQWLILRRYAALHAPVWVPTTISGTIFGYALGAGLLLFVLAVLRLAFADDSSPTMRSLVLLAVILGGALAGAVLGRLQWNALEDQGVSKRGWIAATCVGGVLYALAFSSQSVSDVVRASDALVWSILTLPYVLRMAVAATLYGVMSGYALEPLTRHDPSARPIVSASHREPTNGHHPPTNGWHV